VFSRLSRGGRTDDRPSGKRNTDLVAEFSQELPKRIDFLNRDGLASAASIKKARKRSAARTPASDA